MGRKIFKKAFLFGVSYVAIKWLIILVVGGALIKSGHWSNWYLLAIPVIGGSVFLIRKRMKAKKDKNK